MKVILKTAPKFKAKKLADEIIRKRWMEFQRKILIVGVHTWKYMQHYIGQYSKRKTTGNLAKSITFEKLTGMAQVGFGIGNVNILNTSAPYWYVLNYGKTTSGKSFRPGGGKYRPVRFNGTPAKKGTMENQRASVFVPIGGGKVPKVIRPLRYIDASILKFNIEFRALLAKLKSGV